MRLFSVHAGRYYSEIEQSSGFLYTMREWVRTGETWSYACHEDLRWLGREISGEGTRAPKDTTVTVIL
jgi:hypothetical protein